jgi:riboflavin biosynthesis pyrimidine reductase
VRAENYSGVKASTARAERRARLGRSPVPPVAVVTAGAGIDPGHPVITETRVPTMIITTGRAPSDRVDALTGAGARVIVAGERKVDLTAALAELSRLGLHRIDCEGGPHLFGELIAEDLVDQLCLTVAPLLAGAGANRIALGRASGAPRSLELASLLQEEGYTMLRYRRRADTAGRGSG